MSTSHCPSCECTLQVVPLPEKRLMLGIYLPVDVSNSPSAHVR